MTQREPGTDTESKGAPALKGLRALHGAQHRALEAARVPRSGFADPGAFGRMFPALPFFPFDEADLAALADQMRVNSEEAGGGEDNPRIPAAFTFLGQFVDHDITFDPTSSLERQVDPEAVHNFRTPALELDNVYGSGPGASPHLYDQEQPAKLLLGVDETGAANDLPRNRQGTALIGDPRNDENLIVSQLHLQFLRFHNRVVDHIREHGIEDGQTIADRPDTVFGEAQRIVRWHYQWIVVHEFLRATVGDQTYAKVVTPITDPVGKAPSTPGQDPVGNFLDRLTFRWNREPFIPVEFAVAAYRFGHSQVRPGYGINAEFGAEFFAPGTGQPTLFVPPNLTADRILQKGRAVDWSLFVDQPGGALAPQRSKKIDTLLAPSLFRLPFVPDPKFSSLALRNLLRGNTFALPWGERVANVMRLPSLTPETVGLGELGFPTRRTPLWYYVLREAESGGGTHLGAVGGHIVAEVFMGLLLGDHRSYLAMDPEWKPFLPAVQAGDFTLFDLIAFAAEQ